MYKDLVRKWLSSDSISEESKKEILSLDEIELEDRFYKELEFGTGGLRGKMGSGTNRMNIYTIGKVTKGYADFLNNKFSGEKISVAIAFDSRNNSSEFAKRVSLILAANNIKVFIYKTLVPTPMLSFAVRELGCNGGIVITASHNPKEYNGYKVYGEDGGQLTDGLAKEVYSYICDVDMFSKIEILDEEYAFESKKVEYIEDSIEELYIQKIRNHSIRRDLVNDRASDLKIVYTPLHGSGYLPVKKILDESGYTNLEIVEEQRLPDGNFPTVNYPNPELESVFDIAIGYAKKFESDIVFATDPDCDRVGVVVKNKHGEYKFLTGNQIGALLCEYILMSLNETGNLQNNSVVMKTIVSTDIVNDICKNYNVDVLNVLTGFKYIAEKIKEFEKNESRNYIFGFEESYGYLFGTFVRDKDAVMAVNIICEMALYYKQKGETLTCAIENIYEKYGFFSDELISIDLEGKQGQEKISKCMESLRKLNLENIIDGRVTIKLQDYKLSSEYDFLKNETIELDLPVSNVLKIIFEDGSWFVVRPSGTEPKMKIYIFTKSCSKEKIKFDSDDLKNKILVLIEKCMHD